MQAKLRDLKDSSQLDGLLVTDEKGFVIVNTAGIKNPHHAHSLKHLGGYFFPEADSHQDIIVTVETTEHTTVLQSSQEGKVVAVRERKQEEEE